MLVQHCTNVIQTSWDVGTYMACVFLQLTEALEDAEEQRHQVQNLKRKLQRLTQEMMDLKLHLEEQYSRNTELEKKQRKYA